MKKFAFQFRVYAKQFATCALIALRASTYDLLAIGGATAFVNGVRMKSEPAAWMVGGALMVAFSVLVTASKKRSRS